MTSKPAEAPTPSAASAPSSRAFVITGGTGLIGSTVVKRLVERGDRVVVLTRDPSRTKVPSGARAVAWTPTKAGDWQRSVDGVDGVIHLAGDPVLGVRWTESKRASIRASRIESARLLVDACRDAEHRPAVFVGGSAIGIYGARPPQEELTEEASLGDGFLAETTRDWEAAEQKAETLGIRTVRLRTGLVLDPEGGMLKEMLLPFRLHAGGPIGDGHQMLSWIHRDDMTAMVLFALDDERVRGSLNAVAPHPVDMDDFADTLGRTMGRSAWVRVPSFALRLRFGEAAEPILTGQRVVPKLAQDLGFSVRDPTLGGALEDLLPTDEASRS
jgi:uncharacterized protein